MPGWDADRRSAEAERFPARQRPLRAGGVRGIALVTLATAGLAAAAALIALLVSQLY